MDVKGHQERREIVDSSPSWYRSRSLIQLYALMISALVTSASWGFDLSMTNSLQSVDQFLDNFGNPTGSRLGIYGASTSIGGVVAVFVAPWMTDRYGRRMLCFVGSGVVIAMAFIETFAVSYEMFLVGKFVLGFGAVLQQIGGPVLVTELAHPKQREALSSLYNTSIYIGLITGSWITFGTFSIPSNWSWKIPCLCQVALPAYQFLMIWLCPESPRWLASKGREEEARRILIKYHGNGVETDLVRNEFQEILTGIEADRSELKLKDTIALLSHRGNQRRIFLCAAVAVASQCSGSGLISSYLPKILDDVGLTSSKDKTLINGIINIWTWVIGIMAAIFMPKVKRRTVFLGCTSGMLVIFIIWTACAAKYLETGSRGTGIAVVAMIFLYNLFYGMCWLPLVVTYPLELVTTKQRGLFFSWTMFCISASSFAVNYINPVGLENIKWKYYLITCIWLVIEIVVIYFTFVETVGLSLEEIAVLFDGKDSYEAAQVAIQHDDLKNDARVEEMESTKY